MSDITAEVDDALIVSAIDNLISNALKYTPSGGQVRVTVSTADDTARISVTDTGQGLTDSDLERAFGRFQRLSATPTGGEPSIGLGLANVREIAQAHCGSVHAESEGRDRGSCFSLVIPLFRPASPDAPT
ncbi:sensor histidine kinase [Roseovarius sp.]|uniref:sensor histidine kinase n=1 Tax=Roseovarius sp. TaxID=1486281 RepID=UPI003D10A6F1